MKISITRFLTIRKFIWNSTMTLLLIMSFSIISGISNDLYTQTAGTAGAFVRMGFSSTGIGLGNAGVAVTNDHEANPFYNPSLLGFRKKYLIGAAYTYLPYDRLLNFGYAYLPVNEGAGIGVSFINAGVTNIDFRNTSGENTGYGFSTENALILSFGHKLNFGVNFFNNLSVGISTRLYLAKLTESLPPSFSFGFDFGLSYLHPLVPDSSHTLSIGISISDINANWTWVSNSNSLKESFPISIRSGFSYYIKNVIIQSMLFSFENEVLLTQHSYPSLNNSILIKAGIILELLKHFKLRAGIDRINLDLKSEEENIKWSFGFTANIPITHHQNVAISYALIYEKFAPFGMSVISVSYIF